MKEQGVDLKQSLKEFAYRNRWEGRLDGQSIVGRGGGETCGISLLMPLFFLREIRSMVIN